MNKYKILVIMMFFLFCFSLSQVYANVLPLFGKIIYLDAGHGGIDDGASCNNVKEKDINLIIVKKLEESLSKNGAIVYLTRNGDYDLSTTTVNRKRSDLYNRAKLINDSNADMYLSIHLNSTTNSKWRGLQIFYNDKLEKNKELAEYVSNYLKDNMSNVRDIKKENNYYMYKNINVPGILIEVGFLSNPNDNYLLRSNEYQNNFVNNITNAIINYYK